jgi:hypothetical protein
MKKVTFSVQWPFTGAEVREILSFAFHVSLVSFLSFSLVESVHPGVVTHFFNTNVFLWFAIGLGMLSYLWPMVVPEARSRLKLGWQGYAWVVLLTLGTTALVWYKLAPIGWVAFVIAALGGLLVIGLYFFVTFDKDK